MTTPSIKNRVDLPQDHMSIDWRIPLPIFMLLLGQMFLAGVWATNLQNSITSINDWQKRQDDRLQVIEMKFDAVVERNTGLQSDLRQFIYQNNALEGKIRDNMNAIKKLQDATLEKEGKQ